MGDGVRGSPIIPRLGPCSRPVTDSCWFVKLTSVHSIKTAIGMRGDGPVGGHVDETCGRRRSWNGINQIWIVRAMTCIWVYRVPLLVFLRVVALVSIRARPDWEQVHVLAETSRWIEEAPNIQYFGDVNRFLRSEGRPRAFYIRQRSDRVTNVLFIPSNDYLISIMCDNTCTLENRTVSMLKNRMFVFHIFLQ